MKPFKQFIDNIVEANEGGSKIDRSAFIYLPPKEPKNEFAQCGTCSVFLPGKKRCGIFSSSFKVVANASCGLYLHGKPNDDQPIQNVATPEQAGYVLGQVRCENCKWLEGNTCKLYETLNDTLPDTFNINTRVDKQGCCNAWQK